MMKLAVFNGKSINPGDISWQPLKELADLEIYPDTKDEERTERAAIADGILTDGTGIDRYVMENCPNLKFILKLATGYNNIDIVAAKELGIKVFNIPGYSTKAVAQHALALILEAACALPENHKKVADWNKPERFNYAPSFLLDGKTLGIIGFGNIGKETARLAECFGMKINIYSRNKEACVKSDIISLHCPATEENYHMINSEFIGRMKDGAIIINTARGSLIDEQALYDALACGKIAAAGLDVLEKEPTVDSVLFNAPNCNITPHIAFAPRETRQHLVNLAAETLKAYIDGKELNRIV